MSCYADDRAVSEIIGNVLMIGITVGMMSVLILLFTSFPLPVDPVTADLTTRTNATSLIVTHSGGESVPLSDGRVVATTTTGTQVVPLTAFSAEVSEGNADAWDFGESICVSCRFKGQTLTRLSVATLDNVAVDWTGNVVVPAGPNVSPTASFTSTCSGLSCSFDGTGSTDPDGSVIGYSWTFGDGGAASGSTASHVYTTPGTYSVTLTVTDDSGATNSTTDPVTVSATVDYVTNFTAVDGTVTDFSNAQSATDSGAVATLTEEAATGSTTTSTFSADQVVSAGAFADGSNGFVSDDQYATSTKASTIRYGYADPSPSGSINQVVLKAEVQITGWSDDAWTLQACLGGTCSTKSGQLGATTGENVIAYDVTSRRPGGGSWTWTDLKDLEVQVEAFKNGGVDGTWRIDHAFLEVAHGDATYELKVDMGFTGIPAGSHDLQLRYRVDSETFRVHVWDGGSFNPRGATLDATSMTTWSYQLTGAEYNGGSPIVRFVDKDPSSTTQGNLKLDYVRVVTT